jgi:nitroreductase
MDVMEAIHSRRSIREYSPEPVADAVVEELLRAAMQAPSAGNQRPWQFVVIRERALLDEIARVHPYAQMLTAAPVAILVCGDSRLERYPEFWVQDCSAATENLLLAAWARGLGCAWVGVHPLEDRIAEFRRLLGLPLEVTPLCLVPIGRPAVQAPKEDRYDPSRVRRDRWA